jgi:Protein of unknown function (DUF3037)
VIARYTHDPISAEFVNVGVVLFDMTTRETLIKFRRAYQRAKDMFPTLNRANFLDAIKRAERAIQTSAASFAKPDLFAASPTAEQVVLKALPRDDHGIQVGAVGSGISINLDATLDEIFSRFVLKYADKQRPQRRPDEDVWRPMRNRFKDEKVDDLFGPATVEGAGGAYEFEHTWQNGKLHCFQPLSFDLADGDQVREKAHKWLGRLTALKDVSETFKAYLVVGEPQNPALRLAYEQGLAVLRKAECQLVFEKDADQFAHGFADDMKSNNSNLAQIPSH